MEGFRVTGGHPAMLGSNEQTGTVEKTLPGAMEVIDHGLNRLDEGLSDLERRLSPALTHYAEIPDTVGPVPEPSSHLRGRAERLHELVSRLEQISARVEL